MPASLNLLLKCRMGSGIRELLVPLEEIRPSPVEPKDGESSEHKGRAECREEGPGEKIRNVLEEQQKLSPKTLVRGGHSRERESFHVCRGDRQCRRRSGSRNQRAGVQVPAQLLDGFGQFTLTSSCFS